MQEKRDEITKQLIADAGIKTGMRVLDLGCGQGEVSLLLAQTVTSSGEVVGVDRNPRALSLAKNRLDSTPFFNCHFIDGDLTQPLPDIGQFDGIFARRVFMYLPNIEDTIKNIRGVLKPNGVVAFQESDSTISSVNTAQLSLHEKASAWIWDTIVKEGGNRNIGFELPPVLKRHGFTLESVKAEANIQNGNSPGRLANVIRVIMPRIIENCVASESEIEIDSLESRLEAEVENGEVFISDMSFSIIGRISI